ncbi:hypothetical protein Franean1_0983 [Parafrankia sp. EAN1pec]|nr:hypothetical protein Franean1_0983 [Frankia sp. EAN1pec]
MSRARLLRARLTAGPVWDGYLSTMYFTDRGIEELAARRGEESVSFDSLADALRTFVDLHPQFEDAVEQLATWLARPDDDPDL